MKTRRDFLAALGLGAGASVLGLPGVAGAWGGRWRRSQTEAIECRCQGVAVHDTLPRDGRTMAVTTCTCACPQFNYFQIGETYWYHCICCDTGDPYNTSSIVYYPNKIDCPNSSCIGSCAHGKPSPDAKARSLDYTDHDSRFFLDPNAYDLASKKQHANAFVKGIKLRSLAEVIGDVTNNKSADANVTARNPVQFEDKPRYAALFDVSWSKAPTPCPLYMGIEVSKDDSITTQADDWGVPFQKRLPHYERIYVGGTTYHVATAP
jgi:hypothetical protein